MAGLVKKCCYCRKELEDSSETGVPPSVHCDRCKKNEAKYGKPVICRYCQLPAAFHDEKCVYCAFSERRNGEPLPCANCHLKAYFDHTGKKKPGLCRMCINIAHARKEKVFAGVKVPPYEIPPSRAKERERKKRRHHEPQESSSSLTMKIPRPTLDIGDHTLQMQQLKNQIKEQAEIIRQRGEQLIAKDKEIAALKADRLSEDRKAREKLEAVKRDHEKAIINIHEKYKAERIAASAASRKENERTKDSKKSEKKDKEKSKDKEKHKEKSKDKEKSIDSSKEPKEHKEAKETKEPAELKEVKEPIKESNGVAKEANKEEIAA